MKFDVIACGESALNYKNTGNSTIGVNDSFKIYPSDYLVCVDNPNRFTPDRLKIIKESNPRFFYTHLNEWENLHPKYKEMKLSFASGNVTDINNPETVCYSINSPFAACSIAYNLGATEINIYGADFLNHKAFKSGDKVKRLFKDFGKLRDALNENGCALRVTEQSLLSEIIECF